MSKFLVNIPYLEGKDINADATLKSYVGKGKPVVVLVYASYCHFCKDVMPTVQQLAKEAKNFGVVTIQSDAGPADKEAAKAISKVNTSPGVPAFVGFGKDGKFAKMHLGNRDLNSLMVFGNSL